MCLHHQKHHQAYVTNYNAAEQKLKEAIEKGDVRLCPDIIELIDSLDVYDNL